ncbi:MAG: hypothetical protein ACYC2T_03220 [Bacillota bacterium]
MDNMKVKLLEGAYVVRSFVHALNLDKLMALSFLQIVANNGDMALIEKVDLVPSDIYPQPDVVIKGRDKKDNPKSVRILVEILPDYRLDLQQVGVRKENSDHLYLICDYEDACDLAPEVDTVISWNRAFSFFLREFQLPSSYGQLGRAEAIYDLITLLSKLGLASGEVNRDLLQGVNSFWNLQLQIHQALSMTRHDNRYEALSGFSRGAWGWERLKWSMEFAQWKLNFNLCLEMGNLALCITVDGSGHQSIQCYFSPAALNEQLGWRGWLPQEYILSQFVFEDGFFELNATRQVEKLAEYIRGSLELLNSCSRT